MFHFCHFLNLYHGNLTGLTDMFEFTSLDYCLPLNADLYIFTKNSDQNTSKMERENVQIPINIFIILMEWKHFNYKISIEIHFDVISLLNSSSFA